MGREFRTFSESWHRVADLRAALRPTVRAKRQFFRGEEWVLLEDPFSNQFFRIRPEAYAFISRLAPEKSVEEVWKQLLEIAPEKAPGQEEVIHLLTQMHGANLLYHSTPTDNEKLYERYRKRKRREFKAYLLGIMFARIPLFDPDRLLKRLLPYSRPLFGVFGLLLWWVVVLMAGKLAVEQSDQLFNQAQSILAPSNLILLYLAMALVKTLHEFGHALICRYYGGEVHVMGVMLIVFTPLPYMDATSSWAFRSRWSRILVSAGGMITELFVAAVATIVWANTGEGTLHSLAYNIIFIASVSTILFNANPLLKFDGYYIFADTVGIPNLYQRAQQQLKYLSERYLLGVKQAETAADDPKESWYLALYGVLSGIYRVIIFAGIILFVGDQYLILGLLMAIFMFFSWAVLPPMKLMKYLATSPKLEHTRKRAVWVVITLLVAIFGFLGGIPMPDHFRATGVLQSVHFNQLSIEVDGEVEALLAQPGSWVKKGDPLIQMSNWEIGNQLKIVEAQWQQVIQEEKRARSEEIADIAPIGERKNSILNHQQQLESEQDALLVRAQQSGRWVAPNLEYLIGTWLQRGSPLGLLIDEKQFQFIAVIPQDEASNLFEEDIQQTEVRFDGEGNKNIDVVVRQVIPYRHERLPSPALGWNGGGEIAVSAEDESGTKALEPFFVIKMALDHRVFANTDSLHGRTGIVRFTLSPKPLLVQWVRDLRQILQRRYQL